LLEKFFAALLIIFNVSTKLFLNLYPTKFKSLSKIILFLYNILLQSQQRFIIY